jgi:hypothetical protein
MQAVAEERLQQRPDPVAEHSVPAADEEVQHLLSAAEVEPDR